jgi:hypothetical protein
MSPHIVRKRIKYKKSYKNFIGRFNIVQKFKEALELNETEQNIKEKSE